MKFTKIFALAKMPHFRGGHYLLRCIRHLRRDYLRLPSPTQGSGARTSHLTLGYQAQQT